MRIDLHMHTFLSDGELLPIELARRAAVMNHEVIAFTDHASLSNLEDIINKGTRDALLAEEFGLKVLPGVEITHVPPSKIAEVSEKAKKLGAKIVVIHGETISEPVAPGTNHESIMCEFVDILAHPGFISEEDVKLAADRGTILEITSRPSHALTNGHVAKLAQKYGAEMVVNTDTHSPKDLITEERALQIAMGAGLKKAEAEQCVYDIAQKLVRKLI
ncbi:histidinol phosphate phosphatase domain-containing protein [Candidatus Methanomassiliicoccus intestinalis]|uniref:histidinol phosphate phosphatase domain-containing protein n=1 Tax=Candidatus Methanomassiliicoccus intestinalis TaxID=1406512 RepID=UPI0037DC27AC